MKKLTDEMQSVYDFCVQKIESLEKNIEITNNTDTAMMFVNQQTGYWAIKNLIEVNFMED
jgi:hypothetical protein